MNSGTKKTTRKEGKQSSGLSQASMKAMISADSAIKQAKVQSSVGIKLEGRAGVLESEIKLDGARGACVEVKKEELTDINQKIEATKTASINTLNEANKELEDNAKSYRESEKIENKDKKNETVSNEKNDKTKNTTEKSNFITADTSSENIVIDIEEDVQAMTEAMIYGHVDVSV